MTAGGGLGAGVKEKSKRGFDVNCASRLIDHGKMHIESRLLYKVLCRQNSKFHRVEI